MKLIKLLILLLILPSCIHFGKYEWDKTDKILYGTVVAAQVFDGVTTHNYLQSNPNNYIMDTWSWKYPSDRPDTAELITVKATELIIAYLIADLLPPKWRKAFLFGAAGTLTYYGYENTKR